MLRLVVFLGNPGPRYEYTRHNAAWMLTPFFTGLDWRKKYKGLYAAVDNIPGTSGDLHFLMPHTFMNRSGESAFAAASFYKVKLDEIIVVHDEIELPFGSLSLKFSGGLGGHNGLRSMKANFGSADFWRLRIGIGRPDGRTPGRGSAGGMESSREGGIADWVLSDFSTAEAEALAPVFTTGAELLVRALSAGPECLLPEWAKKNCLAPVE